ncbi:MAG: SUMF1/EgtB/PvdO family nonheme iron enzyme [Deltaproteobacteria bacterium]|jgi:hypothetical protein|nr:SUMF1/EgtB/PvdO family nonheme iron enzyme [Deltaproteobacteria bacterium]
MTNKTPKTKTCPSAPPRGKSLALACLAAVLALAAVTILPGAAFAQIVRQVTPEAATNPKPDPNDFLLPLPCDLVMAFRVAFIPEKGYLGEISTMFGSDLGGVVTEAVADGAQSISLGEGANFMDRKHRVQLGSALSIDSLPADFQPKAWELKKAVGNDKDGRQLYLIGKYEVTNAQYRAVMDGDCKMAADSARPVSSVSFYDSLAFTYKLMDWLLKNAPDSLPRNKDDKSDVGLVRLPTEEEWEYAARGGHMVPADVLPNEEFFPMEAGKTVKNYGLYYDEVSPPVRNATQIGTYQPNPLGLYDTIGNVSELTFATFRMTLGNRLHGSAGGPVSKGGSFRGVRKDVASGARAEFAFFFDSGPAKSTDLGFRVAISSVNMGSAKKLDELEAEYNQASEKQDQGAAQVDPAAVVDRLLGATQNPEERKAYEKLKTTLAAYGKSVAEQMELTTSSYVWALIYNVLGIRINSLQVDSTQADIIKAKADIDRANSAIKNPDVTPQTKKNEEERLPKLKQGLAASEAELAALKDSYQKQRIRYNNMLLYSREFEPKLLFEQLGRVREGLTGTDSFSDELRLCFQSVSKNLDFVVTKKGKPEAIKHAELVIIPAKK